MNKCQNMSWDGKLKKVKPVKEEIKINGFQSQIVHKHEFSISPATTVVAACLFFTAGYMFLSRGDRNIDHSSLAITEGVTNEAELLVVAAPSVVTRKVEKKPTIEPGKHAFIQRFVDVARAEQKLYRIPASIKLGQAMLESKFGESGLATQNLNYFGIKCQSKQCSKGHCSNFEDDFHKDFFKIYQTAWESFRDHSNLLSGKRYKHLPDQCGLDYKAWAYGLKEAGYATDPNYAINLIKIIEDYELYQYDNQ